MLIGSFGIDIDRFLEAQRRGAEDDTGAGAGRVVMFVGRLTREKGIPTLLAAVPLVPAAFPDVRFLPVGRPVGRGSVARRGRRPSAMGRVRAGRFLVAPPALDESAGLGGRGEDLLA